MRPHLIADHPQTTTAPHRYSQTRVTAGLAVAPLLGWLCYFGLMWLWTGNAFEGFAAQRYWGVHSISHLWNVPLFLARLLDVSTWHSFTGSFLDRIVFLLLLGSLPMVARQGVGMVLWTYVLGILPAMSGSFTSFTRFAACVFPMFVALAMFVEKPRRRALTVSLIATGIFLHAVLLWQFVNYRWAG